MKILQILSNGRFVCLMLLSFLPQLLIAQQIKVVEKTEFTPIQSVVVSTANANISSISDAAGEIDISAFNKQDTLIFSHVSFNTLKIKCADAISMGRIVLTTKTILMDEFVLSAGRSEEQRKDVAQTIEVIQRRDIAFMNPLSTGQLLEQTGKVFVQQSQFGGSSPVIRGFEANKILIVIDGIRMNNAIYRSGHLQNVITVDPEMLEKAEILYGPGSVIYGSDALGGVMAFYTREPQFKMDGSPAFNGSVFTRYSTAAGEMTGGITLQYSGKNIGSLTNFTYRQMGDLRTGNIRNPFYGDWGKCLYYAERINGADSMMVNDNPNIQRNSGYNQMDLLQKVSIKTGDKSKLVFNIQYSNSTDVPRYDRLTEMSGGVLKYAEWYYGPQTRMLGAVKYELHSTKFADLTRITASYQNISEDRVSHKFGKSSRRHQEETVDVLALNIDLMKAGDSHEWRYGAELKFDRVASKAYAEDVEDGTITFDEATRYPDAGNSMNSFAVYLTHNWEVLKNDDLIFTQGLRYNFITLQSEWSDTMMSIMAFPFDKKLEQKNGSLNGSIGLVWNGTEGWRFSTFLSSGFRAPNVDDVGKVNDSNAGDNLLIIPNPELQPQYVYSGELTIGKYFGKSTMLEVTGYYSYIDNAFVLRPNTLNGSDSVMFDGEMCGIESVTNAGSAMIYGIQSNLTTQISKHFSIRSNINYTYGRVLDDDSPLDHIPPVFGSTTFRLELNRFRGEFWIAYNSWKRIKDYSTSGEDNLVYATAYGMPSWTTLNLRASYQMNNYIQWQIGLENITDVHYRKFASGISSAGRNLFIALRVKF